MKEFIKLNIDKCNNLEIKINNLKETEEIKNFNIEEEWARLNEI